MFVVRWLLRRKDGVTHEEFREHFERSHAPLAEKYIGHLMLDYRRIYIDQAFGRTAVDAAGESIYSPIEMGWDLISEWVLPDEQTMAKIQAIMTGDVIKEFHACEEKFLDRESQVMLRCSTVERNRG